MEPVSGGFVPHKIRGDGDYEAQKRAALAQASSNEYIQGVQSGILQGGKTIKDTRTQYGNVNIMPQDILDPEGNFAQLDTPGNTPGGNLKAIVNTTGNADLQTSSSKAVQQDPQTMEAQALEGVGFETGNLDERLAKMAKGGMNNLNNLSNLYPRA